MKTASEQRAVARSLRKVFGMKRLRPGQDVVIGHALAGRDALVIMPTGAGKSLCYQLPALLLPGVAVVVSPLISLMKDQVDRLHEMGVAAVQVNSMLKAAEERAALEAIAAARAKIVYATPERMSDPDFLALFKRQQVSLFVVDEAHCVSEWGHDFRPAYLDLREALRALGRPTLLALTATATEDVLADVKRALGARDMQVINTGIHRPNLRYAVDHVTSEREKLERIAARIARGTDSGIVYTATVKSADAIHAALVRAGERAGRYHGRLPARERKAQQDAFMAGRTRIMVATNAFGLGIDKPDIRFVIHYQLPANLEAYYQESGRAGRDGEAADCTLLYDLRDKRLQQFFLARRYPVARDLVQTYDVLRDRLRIAGTIAQSKLRQAVAAMGANKLKVVMKMLNEARIVTPLRGFRYRLERADAGAEELERLASDYSERSEDDRAKLERMVAYAQSGFCRWRILLRYFGEDAGWDTCDACDNCLRREIATAPPEPAMEEAAPAPVVTYREGDPVRVRRFGAARVVAATGNEIRVVFPNGDTRSFISEVVKHAPRGRDGTPASTNAKGRAS